MSRGGDARIERLAAKQHALIADRQARDAGMSRAAMRHRVEVGRWFTAAPRVYGLTGSPRTPEQRLMAAVLAAGDGAVASHASAAWLHGIPGFPEGRGEVSVPRGVRPRVPGVLVHQSNAMPRPHLTHVRGIPVTTVARTLCDLAGDVHALRTARALDNCLTRGKVSTRSVARTLEPLDARGRSGTALMHRLLEARGEGYIAPASELEARFLEIIREGGLPEPAREVCVGDRQGPAGRVEFVYRDAKLLIEIDSRLHHTALLDLESDRARDNRLMAAGWRVLRITWEMLATRPDEVVALVQRALQASAA